MLILFRFPQELKLSQNTKDLEKNSYVFTFCEFNGTFQLALYFTKDADYYSGFFERQQTHIELICTFASCILNDPVGRTKALLAHRLGARTTV